MLLASWHIGRTVGGFDGWDICLRVRRKSIFYDSMIRVMRAEPSDFREIEVEFKGERGQDAGGLTSEWIALLGEAFTDEIEVEGLRRVTDKLGQQSRAHRRRRDDYDDDSDTSEDDDGDESERGSDDESDSDTTVGSRDGRVPLPAGTPSSCSGTSRGRSARRCSSSLARA